MAIERRTGWGGAAVLACLSLLTGCGNDEPEVQTASLAVSCAPRACYYDGDGDGYGDGSVPANEVCGSVECGEKTVELAGDCNDDDPAVNPQRWESPANGVDDDCNGQVDEALFVGPPYWATCTESSLPQFFLGLNHASEIDQAQQAGSLYGRVYYRPVAEASAPYQVTPFQRATVCTYYGDVYAGFDIDDLAPSTSYEMRIDFYRRRLTLANPITLSFVRIVPYGGCQGDSNSSPACSNSDVETVTTGPAVSFESLSQSQTNFVQQASGQKDVFDLGFADAGNDSQLYAALARYITKRSRPVGPPQRGRPPVVAPRLF